MKKMLQLFPYCLLFLFIACHQANFYETNTALVNRSWSNQDKPSFEVKIADNKAKYDVYINARHTAEYNYSNLFFLLHLKGPQLLDSAFRYEAKLAELDGRWIGKNAGNLYFNEIMVKKDLVFPDTGVYTFAIEQNMRENPLKHISDVGIKLVKK